MEPDTGDVNGVAGDGAGVVFVQRAEQLRELLQSPLPEQCLRLPLGELRVRPLLELLGLLG